MLESHPAVAEAAVVAAPDERWGETPVALVVLREGVAQDAEELRLWVNARVAREAHISRISLLGSLPRNAMGKVLKRELRAMFTSASA